MILLTPLHQFARIVDDYGLSSKEFYDWLHDLCDRLPVTGTATFDGGLTEGITFAQAGLPNQPDDKYMVAVEGSENRYYWVTDKTRESFTLNTASASSGTVRWVLFRY